jgi:hypothetical protein
MVKTFGTWLLGALVLVLGIGGIYHVISSDIKRPGLRAQSFKKAERRCGQFFTKQDARAVFGSVPTGGSIPVTTRYDGPSSYCQFVVPYSGGVKVDVGYTCGADNVNGLDGAWRDSDYRWNQLWKLREIKGAVYDTASGHKWQAPVALAVRLRANGALQMVWADYYSSGYIPGRDRSVALLRRMMLNVRGLTC